jgi:hypothetical protein
MLNLAISLYPDEPAPAPEGRGEMAALCLALECKEQRKQQNDGNDILECSSSGCVVAIHEP